MYKNAKSYRSINVVIKNQSDLVFGLLLKQRQTRVQVGSQLCQPVVEGWSLRKRNTADRGLDFIKSDISTTGKHAQHHVYFGAILSPNITLSSITKLTKIKNISLIKASQNCMHHLNG